MGSFDTPVELNASNFDSFIKEAEKPVLVDFWAVWCGPCRQVGPVLEEIASERDDLIVAKVNVDENPLLATTYSISAIPAILLFVEGKCIASMVGALSKEQLLARIETCL